MALIYKKDTMRNCICAELSSPIKSVSAYGQEQAEHCEETKIWLIVGGRLADFFFSLDFN